MPTGEPPPPPRPRLPSAAAWALLVGLAVRELFAGWTGNPYDLEVWIRTGHAVATGHNPYASFWGPVPGVSFAFLSQALPSAAYLPFWPGLSGLIFALWEHVGFGNRFLLYFLLKQPPIAGDLLTAYLLFRLVHRWTGDADRAGSALAFWALFPYAITISAIWGQLDPLLVPVFLVGLAVDGPRARSLVAGLGVFVKWLTGILLPFEILRERGLRRLSAFLLLVVPLALTALVFAVAGWRFAGIQDTATSQSQGGGGGMNLAAVLNNPGYAAAADAVPHLLTALQLLWVPVLLVGGWVAARWVLRPGSGPSEELRAVLFLVTLFLLVRWGLYEQYMLYAFALLLLDVRVFHPGRATLLYVLIGLAALFLLVNNDLGLWFLSPAFPGTFAEAVRFDQATWGGGLRADALVGIAVLVTVTLLQLVHTLVKDVPAPMPWVLAWRRRGGLPVDPEAGR